MTVINAFHPLYVCVHMPEFISGIRKDANAVMEGKKAASKPRKTRESDGQNGVSTIASFPKTKSDRIDLAPREFYTYSKEGAK